MSTEVAGASWESLFPDTATAPIVNGEPTEKRTRKPRGSGTTNRVSISKDTIKEAITLANLPIAIAAHQYALSAPEIEALTEAWYAIAKEYPSVAKYMVVGKRLGVWGNLAFVHYQIIMRRYNLAANQTGSSDNNSSGEARSASGNDGNGQNNASGKVA